MNGWRTWHRWIGTIGGFFVLIIAVTGIWLQIDEVVGSILYGSQPKPPAPVMTPIDPVAQATRAQELAAASHPGEKIVSMALDAKDGRQLAVVQFEGGAPAVVIDLATGEAKIPQAAQPAQPGFKKFMRQTMMKLHAFAFVGIPGHIFGALVGFSLLFLSASGLWMWIRMGRERAKRNLGSWLWR